MDQTPKIKPEITFIAEDEDIYELLYNRVMKIPIDSTVLEKDAKKKFLNVTIEYREYVEHWYVEEVLQDFMSRLPFWNDDDFIQFVLQNKIKVRLCIVIYQYGTYPGMSIDGKELGLLNKFNGALDFDIYDLA